MVYKKLRNKDQIYIRVSVDLLLTALFAVLVGIIANFMLSVISPDKISSEYSVIKQSLPLLLWNSIIVLLIEVFFYSQRQIEAEKKIAVFEKEKIQYQYEVLKAQINPHFLFNSLNVLSSLVYEDAEKANLFAKKMSGVYRYLLLTNARTTVTLKEELAFLESYIFLESIRFENALLVDINNKADLNKQVIPVSLQLLVENAIKHNITTSAQPLTVRINIANDGITVSNHLQLRSSVDKGGVGLANLQKQYALFQKTIRISKTKTEFTVQMPFVG
jgi:LytS/YehU family sensor histidine kinase